MKRPWHNRLLFGFWLAVILGAMAWISMELLRLDRAESDARRKARVEENVRLALWRLESTLAPLIIRESARPYFVYNPFYPAERAYTHMFAEINRGEILLPSPLLASSSPHIWLHFQIGPDGAFTSPQVPTGNMRDLAESKVGYTTHERIEERAARLKKLQALVEPKKLVSDLALAPLETPDSTEDPRPEQQRQSLQTEEAVQAFRNFNEFQSRAQRFKEMQKSQLDSNAQVDLVGDVKEGMMKPLWLGKELLLARRVLVNGTEYIQGAVLDWPVVKAGLEEEIKDLLPGVGLEACGEGNGDQSRKLASLPVHLVLDEEAASLDPGWSPVRITLAVAWICVILSAVAAALFITGVVSLSERRAAFVSAVTHEMRTPLTTFRMYTEMLGEGMVEDEESRKKYLSTLQVEAERLTHLVENVLAYARLERRGGSDRMARVPVAKIVEATAKHLRGRAEQGGMALLLEVPEAQGTIQADADVQAVDQILFNLVDNACKYAGKAADRRIHLGVEQDSDSVRLRLRDHGPGILPEDRRRLFRPFSKSAHEAARSAPGVGLGLALSRRLARSMGGDLRLDPKVRDGACFVLTLKSGSP